MASLLQVGPFQLEAPLAAGGMARIWRGCDSRTGEPVAIKVMSGLKEQDAVFRRAFRDEVRSIAALDHPHVVAVFDQGEIPLGTALLSDGRLEAGSPYLVMELAGGSLRELSFSSFSEVASVMQQVLSALAHAHARGVIHLDIKAANVLVSRHEEGRRLVKLTDFGIAHRLRTSLERRGPGLIDPAERSEASLPTAGTPRYMAPEQFLGLTRDFGPWTDLYSLGCVLFELLAGHPPFTMLELSDLVDAHLRLPPPALTPLFPVPEGTQALVWRLLEKQPERRFQVAADVAKELASLLLKNTAGSGTGASRPSAEATVILSRPELPLSFCLEGEQEPTERVVRTVAASFSVPASFSAQRNDGAPSSPAPGGPDVNGTEGDELPPERVVDLPSRLRARGLSLYGIRSIPLIDRIPERTVLWQSLNSVRRLGKTKVLEVRGGAGTGKSTLAVWLAEEGLERGIAHSLMARLRPGPGQDVLSEMLVDHLRLQGLSRRDVLERLERWLNFHGGPSLEEASQLLGLCLPSLELPAGEPELAPFASPEGVGLARFAVFRRFLRRLTLDRPLVLCFDDVQWGAGALAFVEFLLKTQPMVPLPILVLLTVRQEALLTQPAEAKQLEELRAYSGTRRLELLPLSSEHQATLISTLASLSPELASSVAQKTGGNPLFAVWYLEHLIRQQQLRPGRAGYELAPGAGLAMPESIHAVLSAPLEALAVTESEGAVQALEIAAVMGLEVDGEEWQRVCRESGIDVTEDLVDTFVAYGLIDLIPGSSSHPLMRRWRFSHGLLRECAERRSQETGRLLKHHSLCARHLLSRLEGSDGSRGGGRFEPENWEAALEPLQPAIASRRTPKERRPPPDPEGLAGRLAQHLFACTQVKAAVGWGIRALASAYYRLQHEEALSWTDTLLRWLEPSALETQVSALLLQIALIREEICRLIGRQAARLETLERARAFGAVPAWVASELLFRQGRYLQDVGRPLDAISVLRRASEAARGDPAAEGMTLAYLASARVDAGMTADALATYQEALQKHRLAKDLMYEGITAGNVGLLLLQLGHMEPALKWFQHARTVHRENHSARGEGIIEGYLALWNFARDEMEAALMHGERSLELFRQSGAISLLANATGIIGLLFYAAGQESRAGEYFARSLPLIREAGMAAVEAQVLIFQSALSLEGDLTGAEQLLKQVRTYLDSQRQPRLELMWQCARGRLKARLWRRALGATTALLGRQDSRLRSGTHLEEALGDYDIGLRMIEHLRLGRRTLFTYFFDALRIDLIRAEVGESVLRLPEHWVSALGTAPTE